jgi:3-(3-hydroxy-phenyl)propionate hydroxylase
MSDLPSLDRVSVVVVGAGPTGLTLANLLGVYGVRTLLVERNAATVGEPRAVSIDDESLRIMQAAGIVNEVLEHVVSGYGSEYFGANGKLFLRVGPTGTPFGYRQRNAFRQPILEAQLRAALQRFPHVTTAFSCALSSFRQEAQQVHASLQGSLNGSVECDYLIGCDGAGSTVRDALGARLEGKSYDEPWLILDLKNAPAPSRNTYVFCDSKRPCIALPGPNLTRRFEIKLHPGETAEQMLQPQIVSDLLQRFGADPHSELARKAVYRFHARIANNWGSPRVFLAGDAAHLTPPFAGQGMNSGLRDAQNIAWKLAFVVQGRLSPSLLQSYEIERRDHVQQMIQLAMRMGRVMAPATLWSGAIVQTAFRWLGLWPRIRDYFGQMKFKPPPRFHRGFLLLERFGRGRALVGCLLPQPRVRRADTQSVLLDEVLGNGFSLLCGEQDLEASLQLARTPGLEHLSLRCVAIAVAGQTGQFGDVEVVADEGGELREPLASCRGHVLLIRPDRYVAAVLALRDPIDAGRRVLSLLTS